MEKYAKLGASEIARAIGFVLDYFGMDKKSFVQKHFKGSADILNLATSSESFQRIVESLENPFQQAIVADDKESNMLILAGPGSGKTKTVAHRCAYLIRVERVRAESILVLCYNRSVLLTYAKESGTYVTEMQMESPFALTTPLPCDPCCQLSLPLSRMMTIRESEKL